MTADPALKPVGRWLLLCAAMIFIMAIIGAATRLTESGLSIVYWEPVKGAVPPLNHDAWVAEFEKYRQSPQYQQINRGMTLAEFQYIFWWEYIHRLWGRLIGLVFAVPLLWFAIRGVIRGKLALQLAGLLVLGGLQGAVGWWMVASGLVHEPAVSHYRLATHLMLAALLFSLCLALGARLLGWRGGVFATLGLRRGATLCLALTVITMTWGAFVAGLDAGRIYNTFPLMDGRFVPAEAWDQKPKWLNLFENHATVQWTHRVLAFTTAFVVLFHAFSVYRKGQARNMAVFMGTAMVAQIALGALTVVHGVPVVLGVLHQANGFILLGLVVLHWHQACWQGAAAPAAAGQARNRSAPPQTDAVTT